ncbi:MAG TPA: hypothetical protein VM492_15425 [Sumerlaeia bacterium]|nr:hypothetical protein [Sumerlaeia bacterium]
MTPGTDLGIEGNQLTRKCLTLKGVHNYRPEHLGRALRFLEERADEYPYVELVGETFLLAEIEKAVAAAASGQRVRVAIRPGD